MARPPKPGKCVHCLRHPVERNWDHVFPESWYPACTAANLAKWQVPSCIQCNSQLGRVEKEFFVRIALCLDPNDPGFKGMAAKALRSMDPRQGKNPGDRRARARLAEKIKSELMIGEAIPSVGTYPSLGERWGRPRGAGIALSIPADFFRRITEKIVRGITYLESNRFIEPPHRVEFFALDNSGAATMHQVLEAYGQELAREPGIVIRRAVTPEDGVSALYEIEFWKQFKTYASVMPDEV
jgi:hypothetical protein